MVAIAPASLDISTTHNGCLVTGGLVYLIGVGCCCFIRTKALREPDNRIKAIQLPHLFFVLNYFHHSTHGHKQEEKNLLVCDSRGYSKIL